MKGSRYGSFCTGSPVGSNWTPVQWKLVLDWGMLWSFESRWAWIQIPTVVHRSSFPLYRADRGHMWEMRLWVAPRISTAWKCYGQLCQHGTPLKKLGHQAEVCCCSLLCHSLWHLCMSQLRAFGVVFQYHPQQRKSVTIFHPLLVENQ